MDIINPHAVRTIHEDRLRSAETGHLVAAAHPPRTRSRNDRRAGNGPRHWRPAIARFRLVGS